jgi:hypothetical protein
MADPKLNTESPLTGVPALDIVRKTVALLTEKYLEDLSAIQAHNYATIEESELNTGIQALYDGVVELGNKRIADEFA